MLMLVNGFRIEITTNCLSRTIGVSKFNDDSYYILYNFTHKALADKKNQFCKI